MPTHEAFSIFHVMIYHCWNFSTWLCDKSSAIAAHANRGKNSKI